MSEKKADILSLAIISLASLLVTLPLWTPGVPNPGDFLMSVHRVFELENAWVQGIYFPRFGLNLNFGYGAPLFQFYPPLASYLALVFRWIGFGYIDATKAILALSMFVGAIGVYAYGRMLFRNRVGAVASSLVYVISPYLLTVLYERGAVAESLAWAILPWLFWSAHGLYITGKRTYFLLFAMLVAAMMLGHNATAIFIVPGVGLFILLLALYDRRPNALLLIGGGFLLGLGISAFYWMPALLELNFTRTREIMFGGLTNAATNTVPVANVIQHRLVHQFAGPERFRFSLWQFAAGATSIVVLILRKEKISAAVWLFVAAWGAVLLLQTNLSMPFWSHVPIVDSIQFPWRLNGVASFSTAILVGAAFTVTEPSRSLWRWAWLALIGVVLLFGYGLGTVNSLPEKSLLWTEMSEADITRAQMWERGLDGYALFEDYSLSTISIGIADLATGRQPNDSSILPQTSMPRIIIASENPMRYVLDVRAEEPWTLRLHRPYFPGWQIYLDGQPVQTTADGVAGIVTAALPTGEYRILAKFGDSSVRTLASALSVLSLATWLALALRARRGWLDILIVVLLCAVMSVAVWYFTDYSKRSYNPTAFESRFENDMALLGYHLDSHQPCLGTVAPLRLYWLVGSTPETDLKYFIHLTTLDDTHKVAQFDAVPFNGFAPTTRWESGELFVDEQEMFFDASAEPGRYQLLVGLYDPLTVQNQPVLSSPDVLPGDRLKLTELELVDCSD